MIAVGNPAAAKDRITATSIESTRIVHKQEYVMNDDLKPVLDGVFNASPSPRLSGGVCPECHKKYFPKPMVCHHCLEQVQDVELSSTGRLFTFTIVRTKPPFGLPQPYAVGYVDLDVDGLRIFSLLDSAHIDRLAIGQQLYLRIAPIGVDSTGQACLRYYFTPEGGERP